MNPQTRKNLLNATRVEAFAFVQHAPLAEHALQEEPQNVKLADRENGEGGERPEHLAMTELAGLMGNDDNAVCNSILGGLCEVDRKYRGLAPINPDETDRRGAEGEIS